MGGLFLWSELTGVFSCVIITKLFIVRVGFKPKPHTNPTRTAEKRSKKPVTADNNRQHAC